ncbi:MAG: right-handed parallel beta-helix repeat-containing protein [bacterium]|nr:right-handed parallel beta-helix repeat-containing protein [bacterium]
MRNTHRTPDLLFLDQPLPAEHYEVGPQKPLQQIGDVPWESLGAGDTIFIHARPEPYREKWVICRQGTATHPIVVRGIPDPNGRLPVIDGRNATTRKTLNFWNEKRGVIKIGGANVPSDTMPRHIIIENLDIRSGRPPFTFTGRDGQTEYAKNCAAIFLEKGEHITLRNCILRDSGNGFFCASQSSNVLVERCYIYDNGIEDRFYEHNNYTEANGIIFQFNRFGPLRKGCRGNNLKDRSAGTVIRYNWIEGGNRQLDLVDSDHKHLIENPAYRST